MEASRQTNGCKFKEKRFQGRLYVGNQLVRTLSMQTPPRIGDEILYHDRYDLPFERWLVKHVVWQVTKETEWTWFHAAVERVDNEAWPPIEYPRGKA
ncbi:MAG: hypothetical protein HKP41_16840 [Desulfobacterales bacterium]|nr:hypothetical protein [Deltaproteobacteria bacterium]MBT8359814.1 hypothetical protein [Deltaproteobacteria bacterium]NNK96019.1 hypothetical protein [Desulfobacterales bacterium]